MNKKEAIKYLKREELNIQSAHAAIIALDLVYYGYIDSDKIHGVKYSPIFSYICSKRLKPFFQIIPQKIISKLSAKTYSDYCKNPESLKKNIKEHKNLKTQLNKLWQEYQKNKNDYSSKELLKFYKEFVEISRKWWRYGSIGEDKAEVINQEITPIFAKRHNLSIEKAREIIRILSFPKKQSIFSLERKDFLKICIALLEKKNTKIKIKEYIKNYFWFKTDFYKRIEITPESILSDAKLEIKKRNKISISNELVKIDKNFKSILGQKEKLSIELKFNDKDKKDIYFAEQSTHWFDQRKKGMMIQMNYLFSFLKDISKKYDLGYYELADSTVEELGLFLKNKKKINETEKKKREKGIFMIHEKNKKAVIFYGKDAQEMLNTAVHYEVKNLKGTIASTGGLKKIKGEIKVIYNPAEDKFEQGKILVTSMTRIEFVPLMRKAKAIITNEGGIACHAAIVSRELGLPCIIGTKSATRILKNNDIVELNLKTGIIKILK